MNLLHTIGLMTRAEHEAAIREAFKAGWRTNAVGEETHSAEYLDGCERVDFDEYRRLGMALYIGAPSTDDVAVQPSWKDLYGLAVKENIDLEDKFKRAATDLAAQAEELNEAKLHIDHLGRTFNQRLADAVQDYEADALAMRKKRDADRKRMAGKRNG